MGFPRLGFNGGIGAWQQYGARKKSSVQLGCETTISWFWPSRVLRSQYKKRCRGISAFVSFE